MNNDREPTFNPEPGSAAAYSDTFLRLRCRHCSTATIHWRTNLKDAFGRFYHQFTCVVCSQAHSSWHHFQRYALDKCRISQPAFIPNPR